jgi:hypothetical protein
MTIVPAWGGIAWAGTPSDAASWASAGASGNCLILSPADSDAATLACGALGHARGGRDPEARRDQYAPLAPPPNGCALHDEGARSRQAE